MKRAARSSGFTKIYKMSTEDLSKQLFLMKKIPSILLQVLSLCNIGITKYQTDSSVRNHSTNTAIKCSLYVSATYLVPHLGCTGGPKAAHKCLSTDFSWNDHQHCTNNPLAVWMLLMRLNSFRQKSRSLSVTGSSSTLIWWLFPLWNEQGSLSMMTAGSVSLWQHRQYTLGLRD